MFVGGVLPVLTPQLFTVGIDGNGLRQVTSLCSDEPSWSVTGTIAFRGACQAPATGIYTIRPNGSRLRHVLNNRYWPPTYPDWSPDGTKLAYTGAVSDAESDIYVSNANGKRARQLTHHGGEQSAWVTRRQVHRLRTQQRPLCDSARRTLPAANRQYSSLLSHVHQVACH